MITRKLLSQVKPLLFLLSLVGISMGVNLAHAADMPLKLLNGAGSTQFSCDTLYAGEAGAAPPYTNARVFKVELNNNSTTNVVPVTPLYQLTSHSYGAEPFSTIALGPNGAGGKLTMFHWYWGTWDSYSQVTSVASGSSTGFALSPRPPTPGTGGYNYWSGGEIRQSTGEIIFSGGEDATFYNNFRMMIYNPTTGIYTNSGRIKAQTTSDNFVDNYYISSDMAIDAEGNMYVIVGASTKYLVRIIPGVSGQWTYNVVRQLAGINGDTDVWGMAFLNGSLYAINGPNNTRNLYKIDVLTGNATHLGLLTPPSGVDSIYYMDDLASCQTAPVIKGKIYNDTIGDGNITRSEAGMFGVDVEIWKEINGSPTYKGTVKTSGSGEYSYIVDSTSATYYIRVKQPKINNKNVMQTWASGGGSSNIVTAYCVTSAGDAQPMTSDGRCYGAKAGGSDLSSSSNLFNDAQFYSKVSMSTDGEVADASVAFTTARKYGDAPNSYGTTVAVNGPSHIIGPIYLGDQFAINSDGQPSDTANNNTSDDGIFVVLNGTETLLQDATLVPGVPYTFRAKISGDTKEKGYLSAWIGWSSSGKTSAFTNGTQIATDLPTTGGTVEFNYTIPSGSVNGIVATYARFRVSTTKELGATDVTIPTPSSTVPWAVDGEVEDYQLYITTGNIDLSAITKGGTGTFGYTLTNVSNTPPSANSDSLTTTAEDTKVQSVKLHAFNSIDQSIVITQTLPSADWKTIGAECKDGLTTISATLPDNVLTILASEVKEGASIQCTFTNGTAPKIELEKVISGTRFDSSDQFTVQIKDGATEKASATTATTTATQVDGDTVYTLSEVMATGSKSSLDRYATTIICSNNFSSSTTVTVHKNWRHS